MENGSLWKNRKKNQGHKKPVNRKEMGEFIEFIQHPDKIKQWISPSKFINHNVQKALFTALFDIDRKRYEQRLLLSLSGRSLLAVNGQVLI
jgi:hypothetical protein